MYPHPPESDLPMAGIPGDPTKWLGFPRSSSDLAQRPFTHTEWRGIRKSQGFTPLGNVAREIAALQNAAEKPRDDRTLENITMGIHVRESALVVAALHGGRGGALRRLRAEQQYYASKNGYEEIARNIGRETHVLEQVGSSVYGHPVGMIQPTILGAPDSEIGEMGTTREIMIPSIAAHVQWRISQWYQAEAAAQPQA